MGGWYKFKYLSRVTTFMKLKDIKDIGDRDILIPPQIRSVDKYGRIFVGIDNARKRGLLLFVELKEGDMGISEKIQ